MAVGPAPSPKSARIIREVTPGTLPGTAMDEMPFGTLTPQNIGVQHVQPSDVQADRHDRANILTGVDSPGLSGQGDYRLGPLASHRMIIEGVSDRAAAAGNTVTSDTIALASGVLTTTEVGGWASLAAWLVAPMLVWVESVDSAGPFLTHGGFWVLVTEVDAGNATLSPLLPIPADMVAGEDVRVRVTRTYKSTPAANGTMLTHAIELWNAVSAKGDHYAECAFAGWEWSLTESGVIALGYDVTTKGLPTALTAQLANTTTAASTSAPAMSAGVHFQALAEPNSGAGLRLNNVTLSDLLIRNYKWRFEAGTMATKGAGKGVTNQTLFRSGKVAQTIELSVERATTQSDDVIALLRASTGSIVGHSVGCIDSAGNRRMHLIPELDLGGEGNSGAKQDDVEILSMTGRARHSSVISAYWMVADADAV